MNKTDRSFTVEESDVTLSSEKPRYISKTPGAAAQKAVSRMFNEHKGKREIRITMRETTKGAGGKLYRYVGTRHILEPPKIFVRAGKQEERTHEVKVKSCLLHE